MSRTLALAVLLLAAPLAAQDFDVHALYEKWKAEESRTLEGWRVLDDDTLIEKLTPLAAEWDENGDASAEGSGPSNALLGICYRTGVGGAPLDQNWAERYLSKNVILPPDERAYLLRVAHFHMRLAGGQLEFVPPRHVQDFLREKASEFPPDKLVCALTMLSVVGGDHGQATTLLDDSAKNECLPAMVFLARRYRDDWGGGQAPLEEAAEANYAPALMELASFHHFQHGVKPDLARSRELLKRALTLGEQSARGVLRTLPDKLLDDMSVEELFVRFATSWGELYRKRTEFGHTLIFSGPNPVLARYGAVAEWLRPLADLDKQNEKSTPTIDMARCMLGACLMHGVGGAGADIPGAYSLLLDAMTGSELPAAAMLSFEAGALQNRPVLLAAARLKLAISAGFKPALKLQAHASLEWDTLDYRKLITDADEEAIRLSDRAALVQLAAFARDSDIEACRMLLRYHENGNEVEYQKWVVKGANLSDPQSMFELAGLYARGELPAPKPDSVRYLYRRCVDNADDEALREAALRELTLIDLQPTVVRAEELIAELESELTKTGNFGGFLDDHPGVAGLAQRAFSARKWTGPLYGLCLLAGHGITRDLKAANTTLLATQDSAIASFLYAWISENEPDATGRALRSAVWTYTAVANVGGIYAAYRLGVIHADKDSGYFSREKAYSWYSQAADGGCIPAMVELAKAYKDGLGVEADTAKAKEWAKKAADEGDEAAKKLLEEWK